MIIPSHENILPITGTNMVLTRASIILLDRSVCLSCFNVVSSIAVSHMAPLYTVRCRLIF